MLNDRSKIKARVAAAIRAGAGKGSPASRPITQPESGINTRPATVTIFMAIP